MFLYRLTSSSRCISIAILVLILQPKDTAMGRNRKTKANHVIEGILNEQEYLFIYKHIQDGLYWLDREYKKEKRNTRKFSFRFSGKAIRSKPFDMDIIWKHTFKDGNLILDATDKCPFLLEYKLKEIFRATEEHWQLNMNKIRNSGVKTFVSQHVHVIKSN
jgi:hypothetical protein